MVNRRKLIVGSGAAAVAGTLGAVAGPSVAARAAAIWGIGPASTRDHAQLVLDDVDFKQGLVNPDGVRRQYDQIYADVWASPPGDPKVYDLEAWCKERLFALCGKDSFAEALEIPESRLLLAFGILAFSQNQEEPLPLIYPAMPVPATLQKLEPDFLPVLVELIREKSEGLREFADALQATSALLDQIVQEKLKELLERSKLGGTRQRAGRVVQAAPGDGNPSPGDAVGFLIVIGVMFLIGYWIRDRFRK